MAEKRDEGGSSSHGTERVSHDEDALFKAQLVSFMETFQQLAKHSKMQELLQASKTPTQTQKASSQSLQSPKQSRSGHLQRRETSKEQRSNDAKGKGHVVEQPPASVGHRQPFTHGLVNGQDSNKQIMRQTIPLPMSNAGCFGGGLVFQAMIRSSPALHGFMPDNAYGAMPTGGSNPMYGNIGVQPGWLPNPELETSVISVCYNCAAFAFMVPLGLGAMASTRVANELGAGRPDAARLAVYVSAGVAACEAILVSIAFISLRNVLGKVYSKDEEVIVYIARMMPILAVSSMLDSIQGLFQAHIKFIIFPYKLSYALGLDAGHEFFLWLQYWFCRDC
ncbi:hypothetical protein L7F22_016111 [Adiantum nelumboides]|nr:hypothetical protein [Adiantum nelumboides]